MASLQFEGRALHLRELRLWATEVNSLCRGWRRRWQGPLKGVGASTGDRGRGVFAFAEEAGPLPGRPQGLCRPVPGGGAVQRRVQS